ncbi:MAG: MBL fold metallo-hydrolase [Candidatus Riflebacteria bacterium]|nr:MBL fold metallo-hydrolase [Candidatus Riflebacteria bacterium]
MKEFFSKNYQVDCEKPVHLGHGVWWVGFQDEESGLHCNPYLIIDGDEAVVIDGGSRPDFPVVMMKILETGLNPGNIKALIYDHYDPDLCGSIPNFEEMIGRSDLQLIASGCCHMFIRHYGATSQLTKVSDLGYRFVFKSGRTLEFTPVPYCHSPGSFTTFDSKSKILFSGDIFGTYDKHWQLFLAFSEGCRGEIPCEICKTNNQSCRLPGFSEFHRQIMSSSKALHQALLKLKELPFEMVAPQHGSVLDKRSAHILINSLLQLNDIGIDHISPEPK